MDRDIKEKSGPFEKQTAEVFNVTEEAVLVAEKLGQLPQLLISKGQRKITVGNRRKRIDKEMRQ